LKLLNKALKGIKKNSLIKIINNKVKE